VIDSAANVSRAAPTRADRFDADQPPTDLVVGTQPPTAGRKLCIRRLRPAGRLPTATEVLGAPPRVPPANWRQESTQQVQQAQDRQEHGGRGSRDGRWLAVA
jgi:hypothetical protein